MLDAEDDNLEMSKVDDEKLFSDDDEDFDVLKNLESNISQREARETVMNISSI